MSTHSIQRLANHYHKKHLILPQVSNILRQRKGISMKYVASQGSKNGMISLQRGDSSKLVNISPHEANAIIMYPHIMEKLETMGSFLLNEMGDNNMMFGDELQNFILEHFETVLDKGAKTLKRLEKVAK